MELIKKAEKVSKLYDEIKKIKNNIEKIEEIINSNCSKSARLYLDRYEKAILKIGNEELEFLRIIQEDKLEGKQLELDNILNGDLDKVKAAIEERSITSL